MGALDTTIKRFFGRKTLIYALDYIVMEDAGGCGWVTGCGDSELGI